MTTYKDIRGTHITTVTSDPPAPVNGQMWYNSTTQVMKGFTSNPAGAWATGGTMNNSRAGSGGGLGIYTAAIVAGGGNPAETTTEQYNGSSWTEIADINTARKSPTGSGTTTAGLAYGGVINPSSVIANNESWNGSSWTEVADLNTARGLSAASTQGTSTASLMMSGQTTPSNFLANNESWDGTSWTEVADLNTGRVEASGSGESNTAALYFGGSPSNNSTELWNGTSWSEQNNLNTGRNFLTGIGTTSNSIAAGGESPTPSRNATEEWTAPTTSTVTFTAS